jgi:predicted GTPase
MSLNIAIIGAVSAGKSTLLNALFADTYSDMKIKRTTMVPQVYYCNGNKTKSIREKNTAKNKALLDKGNLDSTDIKEMDHYTGPLYDFVALPNETVTNLILSFTLSTLTRL